MIPLNKIWRLSLLILVSCMEAFGQDPLLDNSKSIQFARFLRLSNQISFAAEEFERLHFIHPSDSLIMLELLQVYRLNGDCDKLRQSFAGFGKDTTLNGSLALSREYVRYRLVCGGADPNFSNVTARFESKERSFYELSYLWVNRDYKSALSYYQAQQNIVGQKCPDLIKLTTNFEKERYKNPAMAAIMSALVPGSGKFYAKRWSDGLVSCLLVGTNVLSSYLSFRKKGVSSINGWIWGGMAFSFYVANIWGSAKTAKNYNSELKDRYQKNAEAIIRSHF